MVTISHRQAIAPKTAEVDQKVDALLQSQGEGAARDIQLSAQVEEVANTVAALWEKEVGEDEIERAIASTLGATATAVTAVDQKVEELVQAESDNDAHEADVIRKLTQAEQTLTAVTTSLGDIGRQTQEVAAVNDKTSEIAGKVEALVQAEAEDDAHEQAMNDRLAQLEAIVSAVVSGQQQIEDAIAANPTEETIFIRPKLKRPDALKSCRYVEAPEIKNTSTLVRSPSGDVWAFQVTLPPVRLNSELTEVLGTVGASAWGSPSASNESFRAVWDVAVDEEGDRLYLACANFHCVRAYRLATFATAPELVASIPPPHGSRWSTSSTSRLAEDGYLRVATGVALLPNGNLAVASRQGYAGTATRQGFIAEYTTAGDFVQLLVTDVNGGGLIESANYSDWFGRLRVTDGLLWAATSKNGLYAFDTQTWEEAYQFRVKPSDMSAYALYTPAAALIEGDRLLTPHAAGDYRGLVAQQLSTQNFEWSVGLYDVFAKSKYGEETPVAIAAAYDVLPMEPDEYGRSRYAVADYSGARIAVFVEPDLMKDFLPYITEDVELEIPENYSLVDTSGVIFDEASGTVDIELAASSMRFPPFELAADE